jgi:hypothetical protein
MQTTKRPTGLRTAATNYETLVQQAINKVTGFDAQLVSLIKIKEALFCMN